jgi:hypothetical protein
MEGRILKREKNERASGSGRNRGYWEMRALGD